MTRGPLVPGPEPLGDEVVGPALGAARRQRAVVGEADAQAEHGSARVSSSRAAPTAYGTGCR